MTASVTKSVEEEQEPDKHVSNWVTWINGRTQLKAGKNRLCDRRRAGWEQARNEIRSRGPDSSGQHWGSSFGLGTAGEQAVKLHSTLYAQGKPVRSRAPFSAGGICWGWHGADMEPGLPGTGEEEAGSWLGDVRVQLAQKCSYSAQPPPRIVEQNYCKVKCICV